VRLRALATTAATVAALLAGAAGAVPAMGATRAAPPKPVSVHVINLHQPYLRALPRAHHGPIMDKMQPRGHRVHTKAVYGPDACVEPNCNLGYGGGSVQHAPRVYLLLWGPTWSSSGADTEYLNAFYSGLGFGPQDTWSTITSQYGDGSGNPGFSGSVLQGVFQDTTAPPSDVSPSDLNAEADAFTSTEGLTDLGNAQVIIASQSGTCFSDGFAGNPGGCVSSPPAYCAWHTGSAMGETFTNLPYSLDAGSGCGENFINPGSAGTFDGFSIVGGHEYAETITDPFPDSGWWDAADSVSGGEIGDKCAWAGEIWGTPDPAGDVTLSTGSFAMQSLWSNADGGCVMSASPPPPPPAVTGVSPARGPAAGGTPVTVSGSNLAGGTVKFGSKAATGVSCSASSCTAKSPAGTGTVDVRVTTGAGTSATSPADRFTYVKPPPSGHITGYKGRCAADYKNRTGNGNAIDLWTCNTAKGETWVVETNHTLVTVGKCLTVKATANSTPVVLSACNGAAGQVWAHRANGELVNPHSGRCLTDPGRRTANGTHLVLYTCSNVANKHWMLP
jgi:hypothetical protein